VTQAGAMGAPITPRDIAVTVVRRQLRLLPLVGLMFFTVSGGAYGLEDVVGSSGPGMAVVLILLTPIIWSLPAALMVAELGTMFPVEGGFYYWVKIGLGRFAGYMEGAWSWLTTFVDMAIYPVLFADYLANYIPGVAAGATVLFSVGPIDVDLHWIVCLAVIWPLAYLNIRGAKGVGDSSVLFMFFILAPFAVMTVMAVPDMLAKGTEMFQPFTPPDTGIFPAFAAGLWVVMWNYLGWDGLSTVAGEVENPRKNYPRALAISIPLITLCYLLPVLAGLAVSTDWEGWTAGYFPQLAEQIGGVPLGVWLAIGGLVSAAGLFSALLLSVSRLPFVMAGDHWLPESFTRESHRHGTPWVSIVVCAAIYSVFCLGPFQALVVVDVFLYSLALGLEMLALVALRITRPDLLRPFRIPGGWPGIAVVVIMPTLIVAFAIYQNVQDSGIESMYLSVGAAVIPLIAYPFLKKFVKRGQPDAYIELDGADVNLLIGTRVIRTRA
jgi:amino acid transporter